MTFDDLAVRLVSEGIFASLADIVEGPRARVPEGAGPYCVITETGGTARLRSHNDVNYARPSAQILIVGDGAKAKAFAALNALTFYNTTVNGVWYLQSVPAQEPYPFPPDALERARFVFNIDMIKSAS